MRLAVLDVGSNTVHLLVVDAHRGAAPVAAYSHKDVLRLAEHIQVDGSMSEQGVGSLIDSVRAALQVAEDKGCASVLAFATSAVRDATNGEAVLDRVGSEAGVDLMVLPGGDEARLTFLAVRRWFGWSSGRLNVYDIGGGSLEIAAGEDESPQHALSLPLGAGRLTREWLSGDVPDPEQVRRLRRHVRATIAQEAGEVLRAGPAQHHVATSKTFRSLARVCGAAPSADGPFVRRFLPHDELQRWMPKLAVMRPEERAQLPGVSPARAHQLLAGAVVADALMDLFEIASVEVCPWALREGLILQHLDKL